MSDPLAKLIDTSVVSAASGGLLNAEQADRFIDYMWDATVLGQQVRKIRMRADTVDIDKVGVGTKLLRVATEGVDDGVNAAATFTKVSLTTKKFRLDWELSTESLEDNIEGDDLEDHIARMMATQVGNDLEDLAINGDTALTGDDLYKGFDGYNKLAKAGSHLINSSAADEGVGLDKSVFNRALKEMPRKYMQRRNELKFFTGSNLIQDYLYGLTDIATTPEEIAAPVWRGGPVRTEGSAGFTTTLAFGVPVQEVPLFNETQTGTYTTPSGEHGDLWLTFPKNLIWGVKREVRIYRQFAQKKDTTEYTVFVRVGVQVENLDAFVVVNNVKVSA